MQPPARTDHARARVGINPYRPIERREQRLCATVPDSLQPERRAFDRARDVGDRPSPAACEDPSAD
jgi:hypothetical protein